MSDHTHQDLEDRVTSEVAAMHTELVTLRSETRQGYAALRDELRRGFTEVTQVLQQILVRLPADDEST